jgi:hypothetical protein
MKCPRCENKITGKYLEYPECDNCHYTIFDAISINQFPIIVNNVKYWIKLHMKDNYTEIRNQGYFPLIKFNFVNSKITAEQLEKYLLLC